VANIKDHRGRVCSFMNPLVGVETGTLRFRHSWLGRIMQGPIGLILIVPTAVTAMIVIVLLLSSFTPRSWRWVPNALFIGMIFACLGLAIAWSRIRRAGYFGESPLDLRLKSGRCASCGYDLRTLTQAPDGCTLCPECGAAWRLTGGASHENP
jgi:hypothetical protein